MNRKILVFMVFVLLLNVLAPIFHTSNVTAASDISSRNVTSLSVSSPQINDGDKTKVRVEFNDKAGKIQNGDTIKVTWPNYGDVKIEGYSKTVPLDVKGTVVGQAVITPEGATITFNQNVDNLNDVSGFAEFEVQGRNLTNTTSSDTKTGTISSGTKTVELSVTKGEAGTGGVFYYKTGDMLPNDTENVRWFLNINNEKSAVVKEVRISDQIQGGQKLNLSSLTIQVQGTHPNYFTGENVISDFEKYYPGSVLSINETNNTIDVIIPQGYASYNNFTISYKTKITNDSQKEFVNKTQAWYQEHNQPEVAGKSFDYTVQNISANAGIQGTVKGELKIQKLDKDTQQPIQNVKFTLTNEDGSNPRELVTDAQGLANIKNLPSGKYIIKEIEAPSPYVFDKNKEYPFELKDTDTQGYFIKIDNSKAAEKTKDVTAKKVWDGTKTPHPTVYFKLFQKDANNNEVAVPNADIKKLENGTTEVTWSALPELDKDGKAIDYYVKEVDAQGNDVTPEGYTKKEEGLTVTNTEKPIETTSVSGKKVWDDNNDQDGKRPNSVTVNLLANGEKIKSETVTKDTNWQYEFTNLPKYDNGKAIEYTVTEDHVNDYSTTINDTTITNKYTPGKTTATVTKDWEDKNNQDGKRPGSIQVELLADGVSTNKTATLNADNEWSYTWKDLDEKSQGKAITYTVKELSKVNGYATSIDNSNIGNLIITNEYTPETTEVNGTKVWDDKDNQDGKRPESVTVNLLKNGEKVDSQTVNAASNWSYAFSNLPKYENGQLIDYTVTEDHVEDYSTTINGTTITNKYTPGKTTATVTKNWEDKNNQDGQRPGSIQVELYANGKATGEKATLSESNDWTHTWQDLDEKSQGKAISYTVKEFSNINGYTSTIDDTNIGNVILTNTHKPETTKVEGKKVWDDKDNQDHKRPDTVTINLLKNGEKIDAKTVDASSDWSYAFNDLPKYDNGEEIQYTVTEDHVEDYSTTIDGTTITNKYTPGKTSATVTKNWEDNNNQDGKRSKSIEVELLANGEPTGKTATLDIDNDWTHTWQDLDEKAKGKDIQYTVKETTKVKDYDTTINNDNIGNLIITNAYTPETTKVEGEKVWKDHDNQDGKRPEHIKVNLLKNGEEVDTKTVDATSNWTYAFHDLPKYEDGKAIHYSVTEDHVDDYTTTIDGTTITNTYTPGKTSATVTKRWDDQQDKNKQRPASIEVELLANGKPTGKTITLNDKNDWTYTWQDLDEKVKGKEIVYTVQERTQLEHYNVSVNNDDMGNLVITNQFKDPSTPVDPDKPNEEKPNKPKQPDTPSESPKTSEQPKPGIPKFISELPNTGKALMQSWITWVVIACIGLGIFFIFKRRK
ncbi:MULTISPECIES: Cna B-type domain-containing protein [Staphylococcus]|uniref:Cna B-type domain-containing protein n=1 Tax=Staphylococcus agnetis TaxID=985762 RepID=A0A2T4MJ36_9STAP|nr:MULTISPECIES: Cna B-type domain-containing protein [Staphylococcus]NHM93281.1 Cna B-type domain-containing protein [Staphylococcus sp. 10602379]NJI03683.1 Cna B-type domain-containing protein [Staphylococcus agnetis]PTH15258.1 collagen-binding protein [Staphylococcus agnetis]PTH29431.1 collagen-binding protein [Staphylococcus agnetis]PTH31611.1 collagen-binding protein [Staphylococcus agnetis]